MPRFIKKIATGNLRGSALTILDANILGLSCSRVCPVDVLCEGACVMHRYNKQPIEIGRLQRHAMDRFMRPARSCPSPCTELGREVRRSASPASAAGPLAACAAELRRQGMSVTIFDNRPLPGGLNTYGVAEYKLRPTTACGKSSWCARLGVEFRQAEIEAVPLRAIGTGARFRLHLSRGSASARWSGWAFPAKTARRHRRAALHRRYKTLPDFERRQNAWS